MDGVLIGLEMNLRAIILIMGFSVLGNELYNPVIRTFFMKSYFKQLPLAMELSLESLPAMISSIPEFKTFIKDPGSVIFLLLSNAENRLIEIRGKYPGKPKVFIIKGAIGDGKTRLAEKISDKFKAKGIKVAGIYAPRILVNGDTIGYDIVNIMTNDRTPFLRTGGKSIHKIGKFKILPGGLELGLTAICQARIERTDVMIVDEVGKLELQDGGWAKAIEPLFLYFGNPVLLFIRNDFTEEVMQKWRIEPYTVIDVSGLEIDPFCEAIINKINS
jgi:nucleoside-triphosphatase THEP1